MMTRARPMAMSRSRVQTRSSWRRAWPEWPEAADCASLACVAAITALAAELVVEVFGSLEEMTALGGFPTAFFAAEMGSCGLLASPAEGGTLSSGFIIPYP